MPRFVLLHHECPPHYERPSHWDLMLEEGDALRTWALVELPSSWRGDGSGPPGPGNSVAAEPLLDHRLAYLDYEGPIEGDRGYVTRHDAGTFETLAQTPDGWTLALSGKLCHGTMTLHRDAHDANRWTLRMESRT